MKKSRNWNYQVFIIFGVITLIALSIASEFFNTTIAETTLTGDIAVACIILAITLCSLAIPLIATKAHHYIKVR